MAKYKLLTPHITHEAQRLDAGTEVGSGTQYSWAYLDGSPRPPTKEMEPLDEEAKTFMEKFTRGQWPPEVTQHSLKAEEAPKHVPPPKGAAVEESASLRKGR